MALSPFLLAEGAAKAQQESDVAQERQNRLLLIKEQLRRSQESSAMQAEQNQNARDDRAFELSRRPALLEQESANQQYQSRLRGNQLATMDETRTSKEAQLRIDREQNLMPVNPWMAPAEVPAAVPASVTADTSFVPPSPAAPPAPVPTQDVAGITDQMGITSTPYQAKPIPEVATTTVSTPAPKTIAPTGQPHNALPPSTIMAMQPDDITKRYNSAEQPTAFANIRTAMENADKMILVASDPRQSADEIQTYVDAIEKRSIQLKSAGLLSDYARVSLFQARHRLEQLHQKALNREDPLLSPAEVLRFRQSGIDVPAGTRVSQAAEIAANAPAYSGHGTGIAEAYAQSMITQQNPNTPQQWQNILLATEDPEFVAEVGPVVAGATAAKIRAEMHRSTPRSRGGPRSRPGSKPSLTAKEAIKVEDANETLLSEVNGASSDYGALVANTRPTTVDDGKWATWRGKFLKIYREKNPDKTYPANWVQ